MEINKHCIGENAGILWRLMSRDFDHKWDWEELKENTGFDDITLASAVGWLAREDKIEFEEHVSGDSGKTVYLWLSVNVYY